MEQIQADRSAVGADVEWLRTFAALARQLNECEDISSFFQHVAYSAARVTGCRSALVIWGDGATTVTGSYGLPANYLEHGIEESELSSYWTPVTEAWRYGAPVRIEDITAEPRLAYWHHVARKSGVRSMATFPLSTRGKVLGVLSLYFAEPHSFGAVEMDAAAAVADFAAAAIRASILQTERAAQLETLERNLQDRLRLEHFHQALTRASLSRAGLESLVSAAATAADTAIVVRDTAGRSIAQAAPPHAESWLPLLAGRGEGCAPRGMVVLDRALTVQAAQLGELRILAVDADDTSIQVLGYLGVALERELAVMAESDQTRERVLEDLLERLLAAEGASEVEAVRRLFSGHDFALEFPVHVAVSSLDAVDGDAEVASRIAQSVRPVLGRPTAFVSRLGRRLVALQSVAAGASPLGDALALSLQSQRGTWTTVKFDHVEDLADLQGVIGVAGKLLDLAARRRGSARLIDGGKIGLSHVLLEAAASATLARFLTSVMGPLRLHDARHGSELVKTLRALAASDFRHREAAASLFIHANTLGYRIGKIGQLIDRDLRQTSAMAEVHIVCVLDQILSDDGDEVA
ncbi:MULTISPECIES: GAF domain-containing protein [Microbacterium]|nr:MULTISPECIES: GAF domain-containing protein [Microbacterium]MCK6066656.1 helix-turn-helix domain-containing protein [Microbacterium sp. EYE_512]